MAAEGSKDGSTKSAPSELSEKTKKKSSSSSSKKKSDSTKKTSKNAETKDAAAEITGERVLVSGRILVGQKPLFGKYTFPGIGLDAIGALLSGVLYFLSFAGFDVWPLTFICLVPLIVSLQGQPTRRATWLGFLTGLGMNLGGFYWLVNMLKTFSGFPIPLCLLFVVIICSFQGGRLALMGWLYGRATKRGWPAHVVFAAAFAASELVYPLLFPWYYAATVHKIPVLMQLADLGGPILVGLVLVAANLAIAEPLRAKILAHSDKHKGDVAARTVKGPANEERLSLAIDRRVVGTGVIALVVTLLYGAVRISMTNGRIEKAEKLHVGYVQGNMGLMAKRENPREGLARHMTLTAELKAKGAELVVWSETSATFPTNEEQAMKKNFYGKKFASSLGVPTIFGAVLWRADPDRERWFNTAIATDIKGEVRGRYDKQYLLAFGEYLPFGETFPILYKWSPHSGRFSAGKSLEPVIIETKGIEHKVSVLICYEDILPGFTNRAVAHADPELLVNMTNDAWFGDTTEPWQHLALAKFRAIEHRRYLVRSTNSGVSAIIDPNGGIVDETTSHTFKAEARDAEIRWLRGGTVYETVGDVPWYLLTFGIVVASFRRRKDATSENTS